MSVTSSLKREAEYVVNHEVYSEWQGEIISYFGVVNKLAGEFNLILLAHDQK